MVIFPNCKINLGLHILQKRSDGYHDIETVFYPVPWCDVLEIIPSDKLTFSSSGLTIDGDPEQNLCLKAYRLLKQEYDLPTVHIHLHKIVPMGAGLGGGSSDAAFTLHTLNRKFALGIAEETLASVAAQLGSDCSFFIKNTPCVATGRGTDISAINLSLSGYYMVVVYPAIHISTPLAYSRVTPALRDVSVKDIVNTPIADWKKLLVNDFEKSVFEHYPAIQDIKKELYSAGAIYSSLSGSGSAVYGIFANPVTFKAKEGYTVWQGML